jgi:hypothetical protein
MILSGVRGPTLAIVFKSGGYSVGRLMIGNN